MTLLEIGSFDTGDADKLTRQLAQFEDNVARETANIRASFEPLPNAVSVAFVSTIASLSALPGVQTSADTTLGDVNVVLPPLTSKNFGRRFTIIKRVGLHNVVLSCQESKVRLNGGALPVNITAAGVTVIYCDPTGYYR